MKRRGELRELNTVPLVNAVLCADCETISNSPHDECLVCGSNSLFNLRRVLDGTVNHESKLAHTVKYDLEITARVSGISGNDVSQTTEAIVHLLASNESGGWESLHVKLEPIPEDDQKPTAMAA